VSRFDDITDMSTFHAGAEASRCDLEAPNPLCTGASWQKGAPRCWLGAFARCLRGHCAKRLRRSSRSQRPARPKWRSRTCAAKLLDSTSCTEAVIRAADTEAHAKSGGRHTSRTAQPLQAAIRAAQPNADLELWAVGFLDLLGIRTLLDAMDVYPLPVDAKGVHDARQAVVRAVQIRETLIATTQAAVSRHPLPRHDGRGAAGVRSRAAAPRARAAYRVRRLRELLQAASRGEAHLGIRAPSGR
jgi:hypothetical protein